MSTPLRFLTSWRHRRYARALAALGHQWDIAGTGDALQEPWRAARELPGNARLITVAAAAQRLARGDYHGVVAHGLDELAAAADSGVRCAIVFHATAAGDRLYGLTPPGLRHHLAAALDRAACVFTADDIRDSWNLDGDVIAAPVTRSAPTAIGEDAAAVRLDTLDDERAQLAGVDPIALTLRGLPCAVLGGETLSAAALSRYRVFVASPRAPFDSGMTASILDAMAAGLPVVTTAHSGSAVVHGVTGFVALDAGELRGFVLDLIGNRELAQAMGERARTWVLNHHGEQVFASAWRGVLERLTSGSGHDASLAAGRPAPLRAAS